MLNDSHIHFTVPFPSSNINIILNNHPKRPIRSFSLDIYLFLLLLFFSLFLVVGPIDRFVFYLSIYSSPQLQLHDLIDTVISKSVNHSIISSTCMQFSFFCNPLVSLTFLPSYSAESDPALSLEHEMIPTYSPQYLRRLYIIHTLHYICTIPLGRY